MRARRWRTYRSLLLLLPLGLSGCLEWTSGAPVASGEARNAASGQPEDPLPAGWQVAADSGAPAAAPQSPALVQEVDSRGAAPPSPTDGGVQDARPLDAAAKDAAAQDAAEQDADPAPAPDVQTTDLFLPDPEPDLSPLDLQLPDLPQPPRADAPAQDLWPLGRAD